MSRARTLAGAIGSDGALNVADVAGLAAVASSGSASDLGTGTLPIARVADGAVSTAKLADGGVHTGKIADSAVTAAKLHTTAVTDKLGYTPVSKSGDDSLNGWFRRTVIDANRAATEGSTVVSSSTVQMDRRGWVLVANVGLDNQDGGTRYIHLLTNWQSTSDMMYFHLEGYAYNYGNIDVKHGLYMYTGSQILNKYTTNNANGITFQNSYKNSSGYLCLVIDMGAVFYTSAKARLWVQGHEDRFNNLTITSVARTNSTSYF